tara:strand:+ start:236 stop:637 length:402 start_codon:yes stop_codon:yes gene_type:complete
MSEKGVKETKEVLAFVFSFTKAIKVSLADGDLDFWDAKNFVEPLKKIAPAIENIDEVIGELEDLSWGEIEELAFYCQEELGLAGDPETAQDNQESDKEQLQKTLNIVKDAIDMSKLLLKLIANDDVNKDEFKA